MFPKALWLCAILFIGQGLAVDVPFVFDSSTSNAASYTPAQLEQASASSPDLVGVPSVSTPSDSETLEFPVTGGGNSLVGITEKNVGDLKRAFDDRVEPDSPRVHEEALELVAKFPGDLTVDQICSVYNYLKNGESPIKGWSYARDPRGIDYFAYANETLRVGEKSKCVGVGDCDDFAILMSALIESIGGTTRVILAHNNTIGGHAYAEVYLGQLGAQNSQVEDIINWLKQKFGTDKIYTHIDTDTKDVWLNLDWGADEKVDAHPGGPFFQGDEHIVLYIRDNYEKTQLKLYQSNNSGTVNTGSDKYVPTDQDIAWYNQLYQVSEPGRYYGQVMPFGEYTYLFSVGPNVHLAIAIHNSRDPRVLYKFLPIPEK